MAPRRLSVDERAALAARIEQPQLELRMLTAELRSDEVLSVQADMRAGRGRAAVPVSARDRYLKRLWGR
jgi:hypothetical protein